MNVSELKAFCDENGVKPTLAKDESLKYFLIDLYTIKDTEKLAVKLAKKLEKNANFIESIIEECKRQNAVANRQIVFFDTIEAYREYAEKNNVGVRFFDKQANKYACYDYQ
jgi:archaellum biogenesis ATPase FlaH